MHDLALVEIGLGNKATAFSVAERAIVTNPIEKDVVGGPASIEILGRVAAQTAEADRAIAALQNYPRCRIKRYLWATRRLLGPAPARSNVRSPAK